MACSTERSGRSVSGGSDGRLFSLSAAEGENALPGRVAPAEAMVEAL